MRSRTNASIKLNRNKYAFVLEIPRNERPAAHADQIARENVRVRLDGRHERERKEVFEKLAKVNDNDD